MRGEGCGVRGEGCAVRLRVGRELYRVHLAIVSIAMVSEAVISVAGCTARFPIERAIALPMCPGPDPPPISASDALSCSTLASSPCTCEAGGHTRM